MWTIFTIWRSVYSWDSKELFRNSIVQFKAPHNWQRRIEELSETLTLVVRRCVIIAKACIYRPALEYITSVTRLVQAYVSNPSRGVFSLPDLWQFFCNINDSRISVATSPKGFLHDSYYSWWVNLLSRSPPLLSLFAPSPSTRLNG